MRSRNDIERHLRALVGLPLSAVHRAADMATFQFGPLRPYRKGTVGEFALHIQCPWRLEGPDGIVTGREDLSEFEDDGPSLLDARLKIFLRSDRRKVRAVTADSLGGFALVLAGGCRLVAFPSGSRGEFWRLFKPGADALHFVVDSDGSPE